MPWKPRRLVLVAVPALLVAALVTGCGKYDHLERNMQYVSDELLHQDAQVSWDNLVKAHDAWRSAGAGREQDNKAYITYQDAYQQYVIVYNELLDRSKAGYAAHLHLPTDELPPPPPGVAVKTPSKAAPAPAPTPAPEPKGRELNDAAPVAPAKPVRAAAAPASGIPMPTPAKDNPFVAPRGASTAAAAKRTGSTDASAAAGDRYVVAPGDTLRSIAKRHGVSEKSLMEANGLSDPDKIAAGKALTIPAR